MVEERRLIIMINAIYFFATDIDLCNIFEPIEREFDIKYCANYVYADAESDEKPRIEFDTIREIAGSCGELFYIVHKSQNMDTICQELQDGKRVRYITSCADDNRSCLTFRTKYDYQNGYEGDYEVYIPRKWETEFTGALFKRVVREVKRNCVRIKNISPFYVGKEIYKNAGSYIFSGQGARFPVIVTDADETKRWWKNPNVRQFMDKPVREQLPFLREVFSQKRLKDFDIHKAHWKDWPEDYEIYEGIYYNLAVNQDLSLLKETAALFDDSVTVKEPFYMRLTAMEQLRDIEIEWAYAQKADGMRLLLENLKYVPEQGYHCGKVDVIKTLLKKRYYETFKESLSAITNETKEIVTSIVKDIPDKRLQKQVDEVTELLEHEDHKLREQASISADSMSNLSS